MSNPTEGIAAESVQHAERQTAGQYDLRCTAEQLAAVAAWATAGRDMDAVELRLDGDQLHASQGDARARFEASGATLSYDGDQAARSLGPSCPSCGGASRYYDGGEEQIEPGWYCDDYLTRGDEEGCEYDDPIASSPSRQPGESQAGAHDDAHTIEEPETFGEHDAAHAALDGPPASGHDAGYSEADPAKPKCGESFEAGVYGGSRCERTPGHRDHHAIVRGGKWVH